MQVTEKYTMCDALSESAEEYLMTPPTHHLCHDLSEVGHNSLRPEAAHSAQTTAIQRYDR